MISPDIPTNFMHSMFVAAPGTCILYVDEPDLKITKEPVIAWAPDADNPYRAPFPITAHGLRRVVDGAILHPTGMVTDPRHPDSFGSIDDWLEYIRAGRSSKTRNGDIARTSSRGSEPASDMGAVKGGYPLKLSDKVFKNNSFWGYGGPDEFEFVFTVPGGEFPPKQNGDWRKIKRADLVALKSLGVPEHTYSHVLGLGGYDPDGGLGDDADAADDDVGDLI